jgi:hypothetical protein
VRGRQRPACGQRESGWGPGPQPQVPTAGTCLHPAPGTPCTSRTSEDPRAPNLRLPGTNLSLADRVSGVRWVCPPNFSSSVSRLQKRTERRGKRARVKGVGEKATETEAGWGTIPHLPATGRSQLGAQHLPPGAYPQLHLLQSGSHQLSCGDRGVIVAMSQTTFLGPPLRRPPVQESHSQPVTAPWFAPGHGSPAPVAASASSRTEEDYLSKCLSVVTPPLSLCASGEVHYIRSFIHSTINTMCSFCCGWRPIYP